MSEKYSHDEAKAMDTAIEDIGLKTEQARAAAAEEHNLTAWQAVARNKRLVSWCVFFAFSAIGQCECLSWSMRYAKVFKVGALMPKPTGPWLESLNSASLSGE